MNECNPYFILPDPWNLLRAEPPCRHIRSKGEVALTVSFSCRRVSRRRRRPAPRPHCDLPANAAQWPCFSVLKTCFIGFRISTFFRLPAFFVCLYFPSTRILNLPILYSLKSFSLPELIMSTLVSRIYIDFFLFT